MTVNIALVGAGRIGQTHARALAMIRSARLAAVYDPDGEAAKTVAALSNTRVLSFEDILADDAIAAVLICTPTKFHTEQIEKAAAAGKAIFCEKPIALDVSSARSCVEILARGKARLMIGFNRRFDPSFIELHRRIQAGAIGEIETIQIISRDPSPPPIDYINGSGGLFRDMMIHDFDMARYLMGEEFMTVQAAGSVLIDPAIEAAGDIDTATVILRAKSGRMAVINNSRRANYGYDQRVEVHGSAGLLRADNPASNTIAIANESGSTNAPLMHFFMDRYAEAYRAELCAFVTALATETEISPNGTDGLRALELAVSSELAYRTGRTIEIDYL